jgi:hypothetical protein
MTLILVSESVPVNGFENFATMPCSELGVENPENNGLKLVLPLTLRNHCRTFDLFGVLLGRAGIGYAAEQ